MALSELSVRLEQEEMLRVWSLAQLEASDSSVLSDSLLQVDRFRVSMLQQYVEKLISAESPTFWEEKCEGSRFYIFILVSSSPDNPSS